jgi:hypothetical protein
MVVVILTGNAPGYDPVRNHQRTVGLFEGDRTGRLCRKGGETVQHSVCCSEALNRQRCNVFGCLEFEPTDIRTASVRDLCLFIRGTVLRNVD